MKSIYGKTRRALLVALGIAVTTTSVSLIDTASANDSPLFQAIDAQEMVFDSSIQPVGYNAMLLDDEEDDDDDASIEERFAKFEEQLGELEESIDEVAEVAGNKSIVVSGSSKSTMKLSGRVHFDAWGFDTKDDTIANMNEGGSPAAALDPQNRLGFRRLRFGVAGKIKDNMLYKIEMEFAGGNNTEFRDAYLGWSDLPILRTLLLGNQKRPYGLDHLNSSRYNVFLERPFVIEANNQDARRLGLASYGYSDNLRWNWRYGVYNQINVQDTGNYLGDNLQLEVTGRLANTIWYDDISGGRGYAHLAISGSHGEADPNAPDPAARYRTRPEARSENRWIDTKSISFADYQDLIGFEGVVNVGAVQVVGEYQSVWVNRTGGRPTPNFNGGYVYLSYFLTGEHMPWDRESGTLDRIIPFQNFWCVNRCDGCREKGWGAWQIAGRYSIADYSSEDILGGDGEAFTFGLNWYWNPNARMQFNYITGKITDRNTTTAGVVDGDYDIYGARFMVDF